MPEEYPWQIRRRFYTAQGVDGLNKLEDALARRLFAVMGMRNPERRIWGAERAAFDTTYDGEPMLQRVWRLFTYGLSQAGYSARWRYQAVESHKEAGDCFADGAYEPGEPAVLVQDGTGVCMYYDYRRDELHKVPIPFTAVTRLGDDRCLIRQQASTIWKNVVSAPDSGDDDNDSD